MNTRLKKTIEKVSPKILHFIDLLETTYKSPARISAERIDRALLFTSGTVERTINKNGNVLSSVYSSIFYTLSVNPLGEVLSTIPYDLKTEWDGFQRGIDIVDFLIQMRNEYSHLTLKAIIHVDALETFTQSPKSKKLEWFKIRVLIPKENKTPDQLIDEELGRRAKLQAVREMKPSKKID